MDFLLTSADYTVGPTKDKGSFLFVTPFDVKTARSATAKSWQNREQSYKNKKIKKKKVGSPYPSLTPALTNDQNKGDEKAPQGQRRNEMRLQ